MRQVNKQGQRMYERIAQYVPILGYSEPPLTAMETSTSWSMVILVALDILFAVVVTKSRRYQYFYCHF